MKIVITTLGSIITVAIFIGLTVMYTGAFNVATTWKDPALLRWILVTTRESSIERRAQAVQAPALDSESRVYNGFRSYREMCANCHTPPGSKQSPVAKGLNPTPPNLSKDEGHNMSTAELFWVIKNGIRMTGMPAWGPSHSDEELWDIVAFVEALPKISAADYRELDRRMLPGHGHEEGRPTNGTPHRDQRVDDSHGD